MSATREVPWKVTDAALTLAESNSASSPAGRGTQYHAYSCTIVRMLLSRPFQVVTPTVDGDVLAVLARADAAFTPPQVRDLIGIHSVEGVRNALRRLTAQGIVTRERYGNAYVYRLNREHVAARHIIGLADSSGEVLQRMREQLATWPVQCEFAALFGSAATGAMSEDSDIDVLIVRPDSVDVEGDSSWHDQVAEFERAATSWTGNDTRVLELTAAEVGKGAKRERVLRDIARDGISLAGPSDYLSAHRPTLWCEHKGDKDGPRSDRAAATASGMVAAARQQRSASAELPDVDLHRPQRQQHRGH